MHQKEKKKRSHGKKRSPLECHQSADGENRETKKKKTKKMGKKKNQQPQTLKPNQEFVQGSDVCVCVPCLQTSRYIRVGAGRARRCSSSERSQPSAAPSAAPAPSLRHRHCVPSVDDLVDCGLLVPRARDDVFVIR